MFIEYLLNIINWIFIEYNYIQWIFELNHHWIFIDYPSNMDTNLATKYSPYISMLNQYSIWIFIEYSKIFQSILNGTRWKHDEKRLNHLKMTQLQQLIILSTSVWWLTPDILRLRRKTQLYKWLLRFSSRTQRVLLTERFQSFHARSIFWVCAPVMGSMKLLKYVYR